MKKFLLLIALVVGFVSLQAQVKLRKIDASAELTVGARMDSLQMVRALGAPIRYRSYYDDEIYSAIVTQYSYSDLSFTLLDNALEMFNIRNLGYEVCIDNLYKIQVGTSFDAFMAQIPKSDVQVKEVKGYKHLSFRIKNSQLFSDGVLVIRVDDKGLVTNIVWHFTA